MKAAKSNKLAVLLAVSAGLVIAGLPLMNKTVYATEQKMAALRDGQYDPQEAKNEARNQRLQGPKRAQ
ncbi:hypothetical protein ABPG75_004499 [Micractinium tetrahymenae]